VRIAGDAYVSDMKNMNKKRVMEIGRSDPID
jgi:hypothetical protein